MNVIRFIKNWTLPISMLTGAISYFIYVSIPILAPTKPWVISLISYLQPFLIFCMLFVTFCKVSPRDLRLCRWHVWLVLFQIVSFALLSVVLIVFPNIDSRIVIEGAMLCLICPTATAAAVVTGKLGGNAATLVTYTIIANVATALIAPVLLPMAHPHEGLTFGPAFFMIIKKVFPILICPLLLAWLVRYLFPAFHGLVLKCKDLAFYLWAFSLAIAIAVTVRSIVHANVNPWLEVGVAAASLVCCVAQFAFGKRVGTHYGERISAGQALGQKNTVFIIWMGYTFLSPVMSVAGGFYSVWHNVINSYQLYKKRKTDEVAPK